MQFVGQQNNKHKENETADIFNRKRKNKEQKIDVKGFLVLFKWDSPTFFLMQCLCECFF